MNKPLKELQGFDEAIKIARTQEAAEQGYDFDSVGDVVIPGIRRVHHWSKLVQLAVLAAFAWFRH